MECLDSVDQSVMMSGFRYLDILTDQTKFPDITGICGNAANDAKARVRKANQKAIGEAKAKWSEWWSKNKTKYGRE